MDRMRSAMLLSVLSILAGIGIALFSGSPFPPWSLWMSFALISLGVYLFYYSREGIKISPKTLVASSYYAAASAIIGFLPPFFAVPWGMKIDLVALPWIVCWISTGTSAAILSALISVPIVGFLEPFLGGGWVGGLSKFLASIWSFLIPALVVALGTKKEDLIGKNSYAALASLLVAIVRAIVMSLFNYYLAIPWYYGIKPEDFLGMLEKGMGGVGLLFGLKGITLFLAEISFWNALQAIMEFWVAVYLYRILRRTQRRI